MAYRFELDVPNAVFVAHLVHADASQADWHSHLDRLEEALARTASDPRRLSIVILLDAGFPVPDAKTRQRVAQVTSSPSFTPFVAIVTENPLIRGVLTALSWVRKQRHEHRVVTSSAEAVEWLEERREAPIPALRRMVANLDVARAS